MQIAHGINLEYVCEDGHHKHVADEAEALVQIKIYEADEDD